MFSAKRGIKAIRELFSPENAEKKPVKAIKIRSGAEPSGKTAGLSCDVLKIISSQSEVKDATHFVATCRYFQISSTKIHLDFRTALELVVEGVPEIEYKDRKEATLVRFKQILNQLDSINFLTMRGTVINKPGYTIENATLLQAAWGEGDKELCQLILSKFKSLPEKQEALRQIETRFPKEVESKESKEVVKKRRVEIWNPIVATITANDEKALIAVHGLYKDLVKPRVIKQGKHFLHEKILKEAAKIYNAHWYTWSPGQRLLFSDYILGYLQRQSPGCLGAATCAGVWNFFKRVNPLQQVPRSFKIKTNGVDFYPAVLSDRNTFRVVDGEGEIGRFIGTGPTSFWDYIQRTISDLEQLKEELQQSIASESELALKLSN